MKTEPKKLDLVVFENTRTQKLWLINLDTNGAIFLRAGTTYWDLKTLGFIRIKVPGKLMQKIIRDVRAGKIKDVNLEDLIPTVYPEELL